MRGRHAGPSVNIATVLALGQFLLVGIASVVAMALGVTFLIGHMSACRWHGDTDRLWRFHLRQFAIAAVAPVIGADSDDIAASICSPQCSASSSC